MSDTSQTIAATVLGATLGALAGYLYFTRGGRQLRRQIEPVVLDLVRDARGLRQAAAQAIEGLAGIMGR
jgi:hypothetical protein